MHTVILFHVTPECNRLPILDMGIRPEFSTGKRTVSWYVSDMALTWALAHISAKRKLPVSELCVFRCIVQLWDFRKTCWQGVFTCSTVIVPHSVIDLEAYLSEPRR